MGGEHITLSGKVNLDNLRFITEEYYNSMQQGKILMNDILICKDGALTGKVAIIDEKFPYKNSAVNEHIFILRGNSKINQSYLFNILYSKMGQNILKSAIQGAGQGGLNRENLLSLKLPLPPMNIQQEIVKEIEAQDNIELKNIYQINLLNNQITKEIEKIDGKQDTIGNIAIKVTDGSHNPPKKVYSKDYYMLSAINITNSGIDLSAGCRYISQKDYEQENKRTQIQENDILLSIVGTIGKSLLVNSNIGNITVQRSVAVIRPNTKVIDPKYLLLYVRSSAFQNILTELAHGSQQQGVYLDQLKSIKIKVPSIQEQKRIVAEIMPLEEEIEKLQKEIDAIPTKKQAILDKYLK